MGPREAGTSMVVPFVQSQQPDPNADPTPPKQDQLELVSAGTRDGESAGSDPHGERGGLAEAVSIEVDIFRA